MQQNMLSNIQYYIGSLCLKQKKETCLLIAYRATKNSRNNLYIENFIFRLSRGSFFQDQSKIFFEGNCTLIVWNLKQENSLV